MPGARSHAPATSALPVCLLAAPKPLEDATTPWNPLGLSLCSFPSSVSLPREHPNAVVAAVLNHHGHRPPLAPPMSPRAPPCSPSSSPSSHATPGAPQRLQRRRSPPLHPVIAAGDSRRRGRPRARRPSLRIPCEPPSFPLLSVCLLVHHSDRAELSRTRRRHRTSPSWPQPPLPVF